MDRLRLASIILDDLAMSGEKELDISDEWSEEDLRDLSAATWKYAMDSEDDAEGG